MRYPPVLLLTASLLTGSLPSHSQENDSLDVRFSGFATFGSAYNDNEDMGFRRTLDQDIYAAGDWEHRLDSRLGLQWNLRWSPRFDAAVQVVLDQTAREHDEDYLDWAFLRYQPRDGSEWRIGRIGFDVFMLSDSRQIGYTYPWVRPPVDFYGLIALYSMDGLDYQHRFDGEENTLYAKAFVGRSHYHTPLRSSGGFNLDLDPIYGFTLLLEHEPWRIRLSHADLTFASETEAAPLADILNTLGAVWPDAPLLAGEFLVEDTRYTYSAIGASYDNNNWLLHSELAILRGERDLLPNSTHGYVSVARRFERFTAFIVFGKSQPRDNARTTVLPVILPPPQQAALEALRDSTIDLINRSRAEQESYGIGLRWDFTSRMALKLQYDRYEVEENGSSLWHPERKASGNANIFSISLDVLF